MNAQLTFVTPPPGFAPFVDFVLDEVEGATGLYTLRVAEAGQTRLFVLDASVYLRQYSPFISDEQAGSLGLERAEDALVLVVANSGNGGPTTMNLMAPIVVNATTGQCAQFILDGQDWPLRAELVGAN